MPRKKGKPDVRRVVCRGHHIHWIRGLLIAHYRREITWREFYQMFGFSERYIKYLRHDQRAGGRETVRRLLEVTRQHGLMIHLSDFYEDDSPNQESAKTWKLWKDYTH